MKKKMILEKLDRIERLVLMTKTVLTMDEVALYTGLSKGYLYRLTSAHKIPHSKPGGKLIYFSKDKIDDWLLRNQHKTEEIINQEALDYVMNRR